MRFHRLPSGQIVSDFGIQILAGTTLDDTDISAIGNVSTGYVPDADRLCEKWAKDKHNVDKIGVRSYLKSTIVKPVTSNLKLNLNPEAVAHHVWDNTEGSTVATDSASVSSSITTETSVTWSESLTATLSISIEGGTPFGKASADASVSTTVGHDASKSKTHQISSDSSVSVEVPPYKAELAVLLLKRGNLSFELDLTERLVGYCEVLLEAGTDLIRVDASELQPYYAGKRFVSKVEFGFAIDSEIKTITLPDADDDTVTNAIKGELAKLGGNKEGYSGDEGTPIGYIESAQSGLKSIDANLQTAIGLLA